MQNSGIRPPISERNEHQATKIKKSVKSEMANSKLDSKASNRSKAKSKLKTKQKIHKSTYEHPSRIYRTFQLPLKSIQTKIFYQVGTLVNDINYIEKQIRKQQQIINKLEIQLSKSRTHKDKKHQIDTYIDQLLWQRKKGQKQKLGVTKKQLNQILEQNQKLEKKIERFQLQNDQNIEQMLKFQQIQSQKLNQIANLSNQLGSYSEGEGLTAMGKLQRFEKNMDLLSMLVENNQQQIQILDYYKKQANQIKKRILSLSTGQKNQRVLQLDQQKEQKQRLLDYLKEEEQNKLLFMEDLGELQKQYEELKNQNKMLKEKVRAL